MLAWVMAGHRIDPRCYMLRRTPTRRARRRTEVIVFHCLAIFDPLDDDREPVLYGRLYGPAESDQQLLRRDLAEARAALERESGLPYVVAACPLKATMGVLP